MVVYSLFIPRFWLQYLPGRQVNRIGLSCFSFLLLFLFMLPALFAQDLPSDLGFKLLNNRKSVKIPFKGVSNLIVIPVMVENQIPLQFVLDTGVKTAILTDRIYGDLIGINYVRKYTLRGAGKFQVVEAYVASDVSFYLPDIEGNSLTLIVLEEDYLDLSSQLGFKVDGILGYDFFSRFVVKIDYESQELTIYDPKYFKPPKRHKKVKLKIENTKPYIELMMREKEGTKERPLSLMLDTGASHALLLHQDESNKRYSLPEKTLFSTLGRGLGGDVFGHIGRIESLRLQDFYFEQVLASFPQDSTYGNAEDWSDRGGTIGGNFLNRFTVTIDYPGEAVYLKKGRRFKEPFVFNKSGLTLVAKGPALNSFEIQEVQEDSPAYHAGVRVGDKLLKINGQNASNLELSTILEILAKHEGKKIKLLMERNGKKFKVLFRLKDII